MSQTKTIKYIVDGKKAEDGIKKITAEEKKRLSQLKETEKEQKDLIDSMGIFGMTVGGLKANFKGMRVAAGLAFNSIKAGLIATGIGAFLVAIGSLVSYFTQTKKGAEQLEVVLATLGAAFKVITDRFATFGSAILKVFKGDFKGAAEDIKDTFVGIGEEIKNDIRLTNELARASVKLRDSERDLKVETAQRRAEIEKLKLVAEDITKSESVRLAAAQKAFKIENDLLEKRIFNAKESVRIQKEQMALSENMPEDLDKLAELEIALADIVSESTTKQIELNNKINAIKQETIAKEQELVAARQEGLIVLKSTESQKLEITDDTNNQMLLGAKQTQDALNNIEQKGADGRIRIERHLNNTRRSIVTGAMGDIASLIGEQSKAGKALAVGQALINTYSAAVAALAPPPIGAGPIIGPIAAIGAVAAGMMNVKKILSTKLPGAGGGGGGGGGSAPEVPQSMGALTPNMEAIDQPTLSGANDSQPVQAYVVESNISNAQALQQELDTQATI